LNSNTGSESKNFGRNIEKVLLITLKIMLIKIDSVNDLSKYMTNVYALDITISGEVFEW